MTHLRRVDENFVPNERHSLNATEADELEQVLRDIYKPGRRALGELFDAVEARDPHAVLVAERRLLAVGLLAGDSARRLEGGIR